MKKSEIIKGKEEAEAKRFEELQLGLLEEIKMTIAYLTELDYLYDLQEYVEDTIVNWGKKGFNLKGED